VPAEISELHSGYSEWKGWTTSFAFSGEEAAYFAGETRGLPLRESKVLEVGYGAGAFLGWARSQGASVAGVEIDPSAIKAAETAGLVLLPPDFERVAADHAAQYDLIAAFDVWEHFSMAEIMARTRAADTMLKPGGHLLLRFPNGQSPFGLGPQNADATHVTALSREKMEHVIRGMRFAVVRYGGAYRAPGPSLAHRIVRGLRGALRSAISAPMRYAFEQDFPYDPVVTLVLRRQA
jgi:2-polyprenyl-3-methyl-5-hydroxy-6-metoxy-1,4-benzoquinol methylase